MGQGDPGGQHQGGIRAAGRKAPPSCAAGFPIGLLRCTIFPGHGCRSGRFPLPSFAGVGDGTPGRDRREHSYRIRRRYGLADKPVLRQSQVELAGHRARAGVVCTSPRKPPDQDIKGRTMKKLFVTAAVLSLGAAAGFATAAQAADTQPLWAWGFETPPPAVMPPPAPAATPTPPDNVKLLSVPGSKFNFTRAQVANRHAPADWFPEDHPAMPDIVAHGRDTARPEIFACGLCHYPNGKGRPENANVTGLSYEYIVQQLTDFKNGLRKTSDPRKANTALMAGFAKQMTDDEIKAAAKYFSAIPATPWIKVVESETAPKTKSQGGMYLTLEGAEAGTEPLGQRIIETPVSAEHTEYLRNPHSSFIAYVPPGSVKKGEQLVTTGGGKVTACTACHGPDLRGLGPVPRLAGRSPSYIARQLYDMQHGNRVGAWSPLMAPVVSKLDATDMLNVSAYLASLEP
jgi:cytochrome c553